MCQRNSIEAGRMYFTRYPEKRQPGRSIFKRLEQNLKRHGSFKTPYNKRQRPVNSEHLNNVVLSVVENPETSTRTIAKTTGIPKFPVHRMLSKQKFHPYKYHISQGLRPGDEDRRRTFCEWYTRQCDTDAQFPKKIIWTDESTITNNGIFNRRNTHYWSRENPRPLKFSRHQYRFGFNMWAGICGAKIIGPFIYKENLNSERYLHLLENNVANYLEDLPLAQTSCCWFQHDGAPAHNSRDVTAYLSELFSDKLISTHSTIRWPARSPDLTPLDFFLWGYIKDRVYKHEILNEEQLRIRVIDAFDSISPEMLADVLDNTVTRCYRCLEANGSHFEHSQ